MKASMGKLVLGMAILLAGMGAAYVIWNLLLSWSDYLSITDGLIHIELLIADVHSKSSKTAIYRSAKTYSWCLIILISMLSHVVIGDTRANNLSLIQSVFGNEVE